MGFIGKVFAKKYTFIIVPDVTAKFIRFSLPRILVKFGVLVGLTSIGALVWFSTALLEKTNELKELKNLRDVVASYRLESQQFKRNMKQVESQLARLEKFDRKLRVITALEPQPPLSDDFGAGGPNEGIVDFGATSNKYNDSLLAPLSHDLKRIKRLAETQESSFFELDEFFRDQSSLLSHTPSVLPAEGWKTSIFGHRRSPFTGLREMHEGIDIATHMKAPIIATADGIVIRSQFHRGYGNLIEIDHGYGVVTRYGHNSKNLVKVGKKVKRGEVIALIGNTGRSTGPHLHYEVHLNGVPVNPTRYFLQD